MYCPHKHVLCNEDVLDELFGLLSSAKELYVEKVINCNMKPERFIEIFCSVHHFIDCDKACSRNAHRANMDIVKGLYMQNDGLLEEYLSKKVFTRKDCSSLIHRYLTIMPIHSPENTHAITFGGKFSDEQMSCFADIAWTNCILSISDKEGTRIAIAALLQCKPGFSIKVRNIRNMAVFFDELLVYNLIDHNWQSTMDKGGFLISPRSNEPIKSSTLSSALNKAKASPTATQVNIRKAIREMQEGHITDN